MHKSIIAAAIAVVGFNSAAIADGLTVGVSWSNFQEERWKTDEAAMKAAIEANGDIYIYLGRCAKLCGQAVDGR